jgi:hypothetical protein
MIMASISVGLALHPAAHGAKPSCKYSQQKFSITITGAKRKKRVAKRARRENLYTNHASCGMKAVTRRKLARNSGTEAL